MYREASIQKPAFSHPKKTIAILCAGLILSTFFCILSSDAFALDIKRSVLPNGLTLLHVERHNLPMVMVTLLIKASPLDESSEKAGLANLTAELLNEGTRKRRSIDISTEIEFIGASLHASVDSDYTLVSLLVLKKDLEKGFDVFSDIVLNPTFPDEEIVRIKELIKGSLRQSEEDPSFVAAKAFKKAVFGDLPYGRIISGSIESVDSLGRDDIEHFYKRYYRPNNAILSVVGDLTGAELAEIIAKHLSSWKQAEVPSKASFPSPGKTRKTVLIDKDLAQANISLGHAGISRDNPEYYTVSVMNYILGGGGFSSRLMQTVRDELGLAYDIHSSFAANKDGGLFQVTVQTKNRSATTVVTAIQKQMERMRSEPVSDQELNDAKAFLTGSFPRRIETIKRIADFLTAVEFYGLGFDYIEKYPQYINSVTGDDILRAARKYLDPDTYVLVVVAKQSEAQIPVTENEKR